MGHALSLIVGQPRILSAYRSAVPQAHLFSLAPATPLAVLPLTDDMHDALHGAYGSGDWLPGELMVSSKDVEFATRITADSGLAFLQTDYAGGKGWQGALLVERGRVAWGPEVLWSDAGEGRPQREWPINKALRALGVTATATADEFDLLGLGHYRETEAIFERAREVPPP